MKFSKKVSSMRTYKIALSKPSPAVIQAMTEDDEIVAGPQTMSLKCPVSTATRVTEFFLTVRYHSLLSSEYLRLVDPQNACIRNVLTLRRGIL